MNTQSPFPAWQRAVMQQQIPRTGPWAALASPLPGETVAQRFLAVAARFADATALCDGPTCYTYRELAARAAAVARRIDESAANPSRPVALLMENRAASVVALLGVLLAGRFYTAINPHHPAERIHHILQDADPALLLVDDVGAASAARLSLPPVVRLRLDTLSLSPVDEPVVHRVARPDSPVWLCYTTGSTGRSKGVVQSHHNLLAFVRADVDDLPIVPQDRLSLLFSLSANIAGHNLFDALLSGASVHLWNVASHAPSATLRWLNEAQITQLWAAPSLMAELFGAMPPGERLSTVRLVQLVGEATHPRHVQQFRECTRPDAVLVNRYGASETGPLCRYFIGHREPEIGESVPIGFATAETRLLLLDENGAPVPPGDVGEIVVDSPYLAPGYWGREEGADGPFRPDPTQPGRRLYATGDLGRLQPDGALLHLGRKDYQVKIAGSKVHIQDVEARLLAHPAVAQAAVWPHTAGDGTLRLVAYLVMATGESVSNTQLHHFLSASLPHYAIPDRFQYLDALPRAANGKLYRPGLPPPDNHRPVLDIPYTPPSTPFEMLIGQIWESVLELKPLGIHDPFLELGGNSLQAMRIAARVQDEFGVEIPLAELFAAVTVAEMALVVTGGLIAVASPETV